MTHALTRFGLSLTMLLSCNACSLFLSSPPDVKTWKASPEALPCTTSYSVPTLDSAAAATFGLLAGAVLVSDLTRSCNDELGCEPNTGGGVVALGSLILLVPYGLAAWRGFSVVNDCRALRDTIQPAATPKTGVEPRGDYLRL